MREPALLSPGLSQQDCVCLCVPSVCVRSGVNVCLCVRRRCGSQLGVWVWVGGSSERMDLEIPHDHLVMLLNEMLVYKH